MTDPTMENPALETAPTPETPDPVLENVGIVVIGRNEGERLRTSLRSVRAYLPRVVYVDSGSEDDSVAFARSIGVEVVELDMSTPFTAGRARNEGYASLLSRFPGLLFVQFLDGDCELHPHWLRSAVTFMDEQPTVGVVCGRLREGGENQGIYNRLCALEWDRPVGRDTSVGGIALYRVETLTAVNGFNHSVIAAEDDEICARVRMTGREVWRIADEMAVHYAGIGSFVQWWKRSKRTGHAFAELVDLHGSGPMAHWRGPLVSMVSWALLPLPILLLALVSSPWFAGALLIYPLHAAAIGGRRVRQGAPFCDSMAYGLFCVLGRFPALTGVLRYYLLTKAWGRVRLIEYK